MDTIAGNDFLAFSRVGIAAGSRFRGYTILPDIHRDSCLTTPLKQYIRPRVINQTGGVAAAVVSVGGRDSA